MSKPRVIIAFTTSDALYARFLRWVMDDRIHHCLLFYQSNVFGGWMAIEIDEEGPHVCVPGHAFSRISKMECYEVEQDLTPGIRAMKHYIGKGYDWKGIIVGVLFLLINKLFGLATVRTYHRVSKMFCSEYVTSVCRRAQVEGTLNLIPAMTWPSLLKKALLSSGKAKRVRGTFGEKYEFDD